jgi:hypothetical protein
MKKFDPILVKFEKVSSSTAHINILYKFLKCRTQNISNISPPTKAEHTEFVIYHPYRAWYLVKVDGQYIGSAYILHNNCLGVSVSNNSYSIITAIFRFLLDKHKPLKEIKSVRPPYFYMNISPSNKKLASLINRLGAKKIQVTYSLTSISATS